MTVADIMDIIDRATEPAVMGKREALEFLEQIETDIEGRKEALRDELRAEGD